MRKKFVVRLTEEERRQLEGLVMQVISELDEIIGGEGGRTVSQRQLHRCRAKLVLLAHYLRTARPGAQISGAEVLLLVCQALRLLQAWVKKSD